MEASKVTFIWKNGYTRDYPFGHQVVGVSHKGLRPVAVRIASHETSGLLPTHTLDRGMWSAARLRQYKARLLGALAK